MRMHVAHPHAVELYLVRILRLVKQRVWGQTNVVLYPKYRYETYKIRMQHIRSFILPEMAQ